MPSECVLSHPRETFEGETRLLRVPPSNTTATEPASVHPAPAAATSRQIILTLVMRITDLSRCGGAESAGIC